MNKKQVITISLDDFHLSVIDFFHGRNRSDSIRHLIEDGHVYKDIVTRQVVRARKLVDNTYDSIKAFYSRDGGVSVKKVVGNIKTFEEYIDILGYSRSEFTLINKEFFKDDYAFKLSFIYSAKSDLISKLTKKDKREMIDSKVSC